MKKLLALALVVALVLVIAGPKEAQAQRRIDLAPTVGYGFQVFNQVGDPGTISIGANLQFYLLEDRKKLNVILNPVLDFYLFDIEGMNGLQLDGNILLSYGRRTTVITPYGGLGLALTSVSGTEPAPQISDVETGTKIGLNILGGFLLGQGSPRVITQLRYTFGSHELHRENDDSPGSGLSYQGGIIFTL